MTREVGPILLTTDAIGGTWQYSVDLAQALAAHNVEVALAVLGPAPTPAQREAVRGIAVIDTGLALDWLADDRQAVIEAGRRIEDIAVNRFDLIQVNTPALAAGMHGRKPVVAACHSCVGTWWDAAERGPLPPDFSWQIDLVQAGLRQAQAVIAPSRAQADAVIARYGPLPTLRVVYNGRFRSTPQVNGREIEPFVFREPARFVFTAGRLWDRAKGMTVLDRAAAHMPVPLRAAGRLNGPNGEHVTLHHVEPLGTLDDAAMGALLAQRPVFVSAACYEPFGLAVLEAAMAGCALVLADIPTFRELWDGAAVFVAPDDAAGFARACATLMADRSGRLAAQGRARRRSLDYTPASTAVAMLDVYREAHDAWGAALDRANGEEIAAREAMRARRAAS